MGKRSRKRHQIKCEVTSVSPQLETRKISIKIKRENLSIETADELFSGKRLTVDLEAHKPDDLDGQQELFEGTMPAIGGKVCDVKAFRTTRDVFACGLVFGIDSMDAETFEAFQKKSATLRVTGTEEIPEDPEE